jgi:glycerol kinase
LIKRLAALGVGVVSPGDIKCTTGTGSFILAYLSHPNFDPMKRVLCSCHAVPGVWVQEASIFTSGAVLRWFRDQIGHEECSMAQEGQDPYDIITAEAKKSTPGANGLLLIPHFIGAGAPHWNPHAKGIIFGLALGHERKDLYRAVLEGVAYEIRKNIEVFKELGIEPKELMLTGGGSRSDLWNQIYADVLGITCVRNIVEEATSLGVAILAASGAGIFPDIAKAAESLCKVDKKWLPNNERHNLYEKYYRFSYDLYELISSMNIYKNFDLLNQNKDSA